MKLKAYLLKERISPDEFAVKCDLCVASMYRYLKGGKMYLKTARKIEKFTKKEVTVEELMNLSGCK